MSILVIAFSGSLPVPPFISFPPTASVTLNSNTCHIRYIYFIPLVVMELLSLSVISLGILHRDLTQIFLEVIESFRTQQRVHHDTTRFLQRQLHLTKRQHNGRRVEQLLKKSLLSLGTIKMARIYLSWVFCSYKS